MRSSRKQVKQQVFREHPTTQHVIDATELLNLFNLHPILKHNSSRFRHTNITIHSKVQSGLLDLLEPGDFIMVDRGFTIADLTNWCGITIFNNIPNVQSVCTKGSGFLYILLTAQEVHVYLVSMIVLRHVLVCERKTYAH